MGALDAGAEYVDVEWKAGFADLVGSAAGACCCQPMILRCPNRPGRRVQAMRADRQEIVKVAVTAKRLSDTFRFSTWPPAHVPKGLAKAMDAMGAPACPPNPCCALWIVPHVRR